MGDASNLTLIFAGELLKMAEPLLIMGLHPSEVIQGYELACVKALAELESGWYSSQITLGNILSHSFVQRYRPHPFLFR